MNGEHYYIKAEYRNMVPTAIFHNFILDILILYDLQMFVKKHYFDGIAHTSNSTLSLLL